MLNIFSVFDAKAEAYLQPFFSPTAGTAIRAFESTAKEEGHQFNQHAADYTLFQIGSFDPRTCEIIPLTTLVNLGNALQLINNSNTEE